MGKKVPKHQQGEKAATQCQFLIGIEQDKSFSVKNKVLGSRGAHVKDIFEKTGAKLRLRGRGSGFLEGPDKKESTDPLMLCVSAPDVASYQDAKDMVTEVLERVYKQYREHLPTKGRRAIGCVRRRS